MPANSSNAVLHRSRNGRWHYNRQRARVRMLRRRSQQQHHIHQQQRVQQQNIASLPLTGAFNLSSVQFDSATLSLLNCGLKFIPTPVTRPDMGAVQDAVYKWSRNVRFRSQFGDQRRAYDTEFYVPHPQVVPAAAPPVVEQFLAEVSSAVQQCYTAAPCIRPNKSANLSTEQRHALIQLRRNSNIVIKASDKDLGPVILDAEVYNQLLSSALADGNQYQRVQQPDISALTVQLKRLIADWQHVMTPQIHGFLCACADTGFSVPQLYAMPKLHKLDVVDRDHLQQLTARIIGPGHSWVTTGPSQLVAAVLNDTCATLFPHVLPDSKRLIKQLDGVHVSRHSILVKYDIQEAYPSIDTVFAIGDCVAAAPAQYKGMVHQFLVFVLNNSFLRRGDSYYRQAKGVSMGTACAPPVANIYFATSFEQCAKSKLAGRALHGLIIISD